MPIGESFGGGITWKEMGPAEKYESALEDAAILRATAARLRREANEADNDAKKMVAYALRLETGEETEQYRW